MNMKTHHRFGRCLWRGALITALQMPSAPAEVTPAPFFTDQAVIQHGVPLPVWGTAEPGEKIEVAFGGQTLATTADSGGGWQVTFAPFPAHTRGSMSFKASNTIEAKELVAGDVWFCSGQSNMQMAVSRVKDAESEIASAEWPDVRHFAVPLKASAEPSGDGFLKDVKWQAASAEYVANFTAVGYFFAREIHQKAAVPVGIINASWGGTPIHPWIPLATLRQDPVYEKIMAKKQAEIAAWPERKIKLDQEIRDWEQAVETAKAEGRVPPVRPWQPGVPSAGQYMPGQLDNGMVHPLIRFPIRGILWYQGESNANNGPGGAAEYTHLQTLLIQGWRKAWGLDSLPFYFVQLPNHKAPNDATGVSWAYFREGQEKSLKVPQTAMAVTIDIGDPDDVHPMNKQDVGHRLARLALAHTYGQEDSISDVPRFLSSNIKGKAIHLKFSDTRSGLILKSGQESSGFEIAAADLVFKPATVELDGSIVVVRGPEDMVKPRFVRYAWQNNPTVALITRDGLPLAPFRTDGER
jgi:sialate O-acetylesterase